MLRKLSLVLGTALLLVVEGPAQDPAKKTFFDKPTLEAYLRHLWVLDSALTVQVSDPKPSELPGFSELTVRIAQGAAGQNVPLYISKDGTRIVQGNIFDVASNPFKQDLDKLKTQFQPSLGTPGATVVMVMFSDFECPHCKQEAQMMRQNLLTAYPTQVRLYFKDWPLDFHQWAKQAAIGGRCVFRETPTAFWEYADWIFQHQETITPQNLRDIVMVWAKDRKDLDSVQLGQCMDTQATAPEVEQELADGRALELTGTPTLFVNGRRIPNGIEWANLKGIIDNEIGYQKTAKNAGEDCGCEIKLDAPGLPLRTTLGPPTVPPAKKK